jgi:hypothetical protein
MGNAGTKVVEYDVMEGREFMAISQSLLVNCMGVQFIDVEDVSSKIFINIIN